MTVPDISVVMSVYNNADTLLTALESILSQEGVDLEFIVIDDGSTDGSAEILDEAAGRDPRLKIIHKQNEGLTRALIEGCAMASAPWIARQDADDSSLPGRLRAQLDRAGRPDSPVMVVCGTECRSPEGDALYRIIPPDTSEKISERILKEGRGVCAHGALMFSKATYDLIGGYRREFYYAQDTDIITRLAENGPVVSVFDVLYAFTFSPYSISAHSSSIQKKFWDLICRSREMRMDGGSDEAPLKEASEFCKIVRNGGGRKSGPFHVFYFTGSCLLKTQPDRAKYYFQKALMCRPWSVKAWCRWVKSAFDESRGKR